MRTSTSSMKRLLILPVLWLFCLSTSWGQIILSEDFNAGPGAWVETGGGGLGWFVGVDIDLFGTFSSLDGTDMAFVDDDANGSGSAAFTSFFTSPVIDLTPYTVVRLEFDYNFLSACGTEFLAVEAFDGTSWNNVFFVNSDDCGFWGCDAITGSYPRAALDLTPYINANFQLRLVYDDGFGCWGWYAAVDNILLFQPPPADLGVAAIVSPLSGCGLGSAETITVDVANTGTLPQTGFELFYSVDGVVSGPEVFAGTINPGETLPFAFSSPADLSGPGPFAMEAWTALPGDGLSSNDTSSALVENLPSISAPYLETFDGGFFTPAGWVNDPFDGGFEDWFFNSGPLFVSGTGPDADHTTGFGIYAYVSDFGDQERVVMTSPCIDISGLFAPFLSFWYHSREAFDGAIPTNVNSLHIDIQSGGVWLEDVIPPIGTEIFDWQEKEIDLAPYGPELRVRFRANTDNGWFEHFIAIDDFRIFDKAPVDLGISELISPESACGLSAAETVTVEVSNFGTIDQTGFNLGLQVDGGAVIIESFTGTLLAGESVPYTFTATADLSGPGPHEVKTWTALAGDLSLSNDTLTSILENVALVNAFPYVEGFEGGAAGWSHVNESSSSWQLGTPASFIINSPPPGTPSSLNSWMTNLTGAYNNNERGYVLSPCFDFSGLALPEIFLDIWWDSEGFWDGANLEYTLDNGATWNLVGFFGSPTAENWYNNDFTSGLGWASSSQAWSNEFGSGSGGWVTAKEDIPVLAGEPSVRFRVNFGSDGSVTQEGFAFDNIVIRDKPQDDLAVIALVSPVSDCSLGSAESVVITVENAGLTPQSGFPVNYRINGGTVVTELFTATLAPLSESNFTFGVPADLSVVGSYTVEAWTSLLSDESTFNDSLTVVVENVPVISTFPYSEDFEAPGHGWTSGGAASSWELGLPAGPVIVPGTETGSRSWVTNLDGNYNDNERSFVISPCFDFSTMANPAVALDIWWELESGSFFGPVDGVVMQYSLDGGTSWQRVGEFGDPFNWYNYSDISSAPGDEPFPAPGWSGTFGSGDGSFGWVRAQRNLDGLAGISDVRLRIAMASDGFGSFDGFGFDNLGIQDAPAPSLGGDTAFCEGGSVTLDPGIIGETYVWSTGASSPTITVSTGGTYWVRVTDANNFSGTDTIVVEVIPFPIVDLGPDRDFCDGALLDAGNPGLLYSWNTGASSQTIDVEESGTYSVTVSVPDYGCPASDEVSLDIIFGPEAAFLWTHEGTQAYFFAASPLATSWSWDFGDGATSIERDPVHTYAAAGTYEVTLVVTNECGTSEIALQVTVDELTGLDASAWMNSVQIAPNPTSGRVRLSGSYAPSGDIVWSLYSPNGQRIEQGIVYPLPGLWELTLDLSLHAEGAYLLELSSGQARSMVRLMRQ